jgi:RNA polymerase sigma factor (sigma-70 family)
MPDVQDMDLVREFARHNSEAAFTELVRRHIALVYSVARRCTGNDGDAQDVTQVVFIILARKAASLREKTLLPGWLYETTRFTAARLLRTNARRQQREQEAYMQSTLNEADTADAWEKLAPHLEAAMFGLAERDRALLVLRFYQNKSGQEAAALMGLREGAAHMRVTRAIEKLRKFFAQRGVTLTATAIAGAISANSVRAAPAVLAKTATVVAFAKGTTASVSTLTLVKGALKTMAWTKAKTAAITTVAVMLVAGTTEVALQTIHVIGAAHYPDLQGAWEGRVLLDETGVANGEAASTRVVLKLVKTNGVYSATTDWIELGRKDVPMGKIIYDYPSLQIERNPRDTWHLKVNANATQMIWDHYIHIIQPDPVLLTRTDTPDTVLDRLTESDFTPRIGSDLQGYWEGEVGTGSDAEPVDLKIAEPTDGTFRAEADTPMNGTQGRPLTVTYSRPTVKLSAASGSGMFTGKINRANTEITGFLIQGGQSIPATVKRADYQAEHAHDADKDYSFNSENDLQGHWKGSWVATFGKVKVAMRLALDIAKLPDGSYSAALANIDQFGNDAPVPPSDFQYDPPNLHMKWKWADNTAFDGKLEKGKLVGTRVQGGESFPLIFERSGSK